MKIAVADHNSKKFTQDLIDHWVAKGHEVRYENGASEYLAQWADIYWVDSFDQNLTYLWQIYNGAEGVSRTPDWDNNKKPMIVCRALDWEVWGAWDINQQILDWVDKIICIAPHIEKRLREIGEVREVRVIRPGVNLDKFTLKSKKTDGFQLGMVLGDMWKYKNHMGGLDIFTILYRQDNRWKFHVRGQHENQSYDQVNWDYYLESRGIKDVVTLYPPQEDMNSWYENIDILLHPGQKEAFCYAIGEAMAKGIPVVVNDFYGSQDIWRGFTYQTHQEAINIINTRLFPNPEANRNFIKEVYSLERMLKEVDEYVGT